MLPCRRALCSCWSVTTGFNGHPPLGVNATVVRKHRPKGGRFVFQWAPTLGGECYGTDIRDLTLHPDQFQWAPTLGGECYRPTRSQSQRWRLTSFNGHPPLGVNATFTVFWPPRTIDMFQWAPTLGGECYARYIATRKVPYFAFQWAPTLGGECYGGDR